MSATIFSGCESGGSGNGTGSVSAAAARTCEQWCAGGPCDLVVPGFEDVPGFEEACYVECVENYSFQESRGCADEWIAVRRCEVQRGCDDLVCIGPRGAHRDCIVQQECLRDCPELGAETCLANPLLCGERRRAIDACAQRCPTMDTEACIEEWISTEACSYEDATANCRQYCGDQELNDCVDQWLETSECDFPDGYVACEALCELTTYPDYCAETWDETGACPVDRIPLCLPAAGERCTSTTFEPPKPCCSLPRPPSVEPACTGNESLVSPASCSPSGRIGRYLVTRLDLVGDCDVGYELDGCDGRACARSGASLADGSMGVDNGLGWVAEYLSEELLGDPAALGQAFADAFCGASPSTTVPGTCGEPVSRSEIELLVELNLEEHCANLTVTHRGVSTSSVHNLGPPTPNNARCLSGTLGAFPTPLGELGNARLRMTLSAGGVTDALLGATASGETADAMLDTIREDARNVGYQVFDARGTPSGDVEDPCDAISGTYEFEAIPR